MSIPKIKKFLKIFKKFKISCFLKIFSKHITIKVFSIIFYK